MLSRKESTSLTSWTFLKKDILCDNSCLFHVQVPSDTNCSYAPDAPILSTNVVRRLPYRCIPQGVLTEPLARLPRFLAFLPSQQNTTPRTDQRIEPLPIKFERRRSFITFGMVLRAQWLAADVKTPDMIRLTITTIS